MNGCKRRRSSLSILAVLSTVAVSFIHAQQINRDVPLTQFQNSVGFRQNFQQLPSNFQASSPSSSSLHRNAQRVLIARQISRHNHIRHRQRSLFIRTTTHQPSIAQLTRNVYRPITKHLSTSGSSNSTLDGLTTTSTTTVSPFNSNASNNNHNNNIFQLQQDRHRGSSSNISRRQGFRRVPFQVQQRFGRPPIRTVPGRRVMVPQQRPQPPPVTLNRRPFPPMLQPPLSPIPFGAIQTQSRRNRNRFQVPVHAQPLRSSSLNNIRVTTTTTLPPSTTPKTTPSTTTITTTTTTTTTTSIPPTRRPIRIQPGGSNLRRKPLIGTTARLHSRRIPTFNQSITSTRQFGSTRQTSHHQPTHRVTVTDRLQTQSFRLLSTSTPSTTQESQARINPSKRVDDIEAAILKAVSDSSTPVSTLRARAHRFRTTTQRHRVPPRIDSIEEAVLRAVLESTPPTTLQPAESDSTVTVPLPQTAFTSHESHSTSFRSDSPSLFPAFATRRPVNRRRPFILPTLRTTPSIPDDTTTTLETTTTTATTETTTESTTRTISSTTFEHPTFTTRTILPLETEPVFVSESESVPETDAPTTSTSEEPTPPPTTTITTTITPSTNTPESEFKTESESDSASQEVDVFQDISQNQKDTTRSDLQQIEENIINAFATSPSSIEPPSPSPPSPPPPPPTSTDPSSVGPPGSLPPSDDIVDELNDANDFLQVAQRLQLLKRLLH